MSLRPKSYQRIPAKTVRTARAACPKGAPAMLVRDRLDVLFEEEEFASLYPVDGRPGLSPGQLALVSVLQFAENLSGRQAADAVRTRIDWKYALGLELGAMPGSTTQCCVSSEATPSAERPCPQPAQNPPPRTRPHSRPARPDRPGLQHHPHRRLARHHTDNPPPSYPAANPLHHGRRITPTTSPTESRY